MRQVLIALETWCIAVTAFAGSNQYSKHSWCLLHAIGEITLTERMMLKRMTLPLIFLQVVFFTVIDRECDQASTSAFIVPSANRNRASVTFKLVWLYYAQASP